MNRNQLGRKLTMIGGVVFGLGIFLLLVKLVMQLAWVSEFIVVGGLVLLAAGLLTRGGIGR
jgi:hypothetical protein